MKKTKSIIIAFAICILCAKANAQTVTVPDVEALPGEAVTFTLNLTGGKVDTYTAMQFDVQFPATGFTTTSKYSISKLWPNATSNIGTVDAEGVATIPVASSETISATDVEGLLSVFFTVGSDVALGEYEVMLKNIWFGYGTNSKDTLEDVTFKVNVVAVHNVVLKETSTEMPEATDEAVNVTLNRTIKAGSWSTIVLPFTATGEQVTAAFGDDVQLAAFTAWESEKDDDGGTVGINVTFTNADAADGIEANTPMLIKVSNEVNTSTFEGVTLEPEDEPVVQVGKKASQRGYFYGTYVMQKIPEENLFISNNKFWYSTGATTTKGYRGYFEFRDVLDAYYDVAEVKFNLLVDGVETGFRDVFQGQVEDQQYFDLSGRKVTRPQRHGVYIVHGKKAVLK